MNEQLIERLSTENEQKIARAIFEKRDLSIFSRRDVLDTHSELKRLIDNDLSKTYQLDAAIGEIEPKCYSEFALWCETKGVNEMSQEARNFLNSLMESNPDFDFES